MNTTSARLLTLLSLLQTPREWPGSELAERLEVSPRTVRRDVDRLRDLGYPVQATMGTTGGYRLVAGKAMPPLLLDDEEAVAIAVGLRAAASHPVDGIDEASVRALAKLEQVLPPRLRHRVNTLGAATVSVLNGDESRVDPEILVVLAGATAAQERLRFAYEAADGTLTRRLVEPCRLVASGRHWYLLAYDNDRDDWRVFRTDRVSEPHPTGVRVPSRVPPDEDAAAFVTRKLYSTAPTYEVSATLHLPASEASRRLGLPADAFQRIDERTCRLHGPADTLEWLAAKLLILGCPFEVHDPPQLRTYLAELSSRAAHAAAPVPHAPAGEAADSGSSALPPGEKSDFG
ncbi:helix-turn-helix transcriptional regulator [Actinocorallia populi]|uniref:helix-turn-helix transcriptional regulator n=1 Tax=Actinocorallia populi TaxID=2079200 RepID=UPI000D08F27B|nr:YafY family protein [Actinocorallia populi]